MPTKKYLTIGEIAALLNTEYKNSFSDKNEKKPIEYLYYKIHDQKNTETINVYLEYRTNAFRKLVHEIDVALKAKNSEEAKKFLRDTTIILSYVLGKKNIRKF